MSPERIYTRRDSALFLGCLLLSLAMLFAPTQWGYQTAGLLRRTVLRPLVWLQERAEEGRTSRMRFRAVTAQRDSAAYLALSLPSLRAENEGLRRLLGLSRRLTVPYVAAEVLHQSLATDGRTLLLGIGAADGVSAFDPVVAPEGLIGVVLNVTSRSSVAMTWAHPDFRVSAFTVRGNAFGVVAPSGGGDGALEFRGVPYRDSVPRGTLVLSSGVGGVYPKGIPIGTVIGVAREQVGWERVYQLRPAANPGAAAHLLVLTGPEGGDLIPAFPGDSALAAIRLDSIVQARRADSAAAARRDSLARSGGRRDPVGRAAPLARPAPAGGIPADSAR